MKKIHPWLLALAASLATALPAWAQSANPPTGVVATYTIDTSNVDAHVINGVSVRWAPGAAATDGWTLSGYNVYRATNSGGPWTKANSALIPPDEPKGLLDPAPTDPANAYYTVTAVETDGTNTRESARSEVAQAANNLVYNASFERSWDNITPIGWEYGTWAGDGTGSMTTGDKVDGEKSVYLQTGNSKGAQFFNTVADFMPPTSQNVPYELGMYGRFIQTATTWPLALRQAYGAEDPAWNGRPYVQDWYPTNTGGTLSDWDSAGLVAGGSDTPWTWLANTAGAIPHEGSTTTRLGVFWNQDALSTPGTSTAYADDVRFQRKTVGATGDIWGLIQQRDANPVSCMVSAAGKSVWTDPYRGRFVLRDVPTGPVELTISYGGAADRKITVPNYGGFVYFGSESNGYITLWDDTGLPLKVSGKVTLPNGQPAVGATVTLQNPRFATMTATTDSAGMYAFENAGSWDFSNMTVSLPPYTKVTENSAYGLAGINVRNFQLLPPPPKYEIAHTNTPPTIDGVVNASEWAASQTIPIALREDGLQPTVDTRAYALWDASNLYLAFVCQEPNPAGIGAKSTGHDNSLIWSWDGVTFNADDNIGVWLDPVKADAPGVGSEQWQIITNTNQTNPSWADIAWYGSPYWNLGADIAGFQLKARVDAPNNVWYTEMKIPFADLDLGAFGGMSAPTVTAGTEWFMQLQRARHQTPPDGEGITTGTGLFTFVNTISSYPKGDLNWDRRVDLSDVLAGAKIIAGMDSLGSRLSQGDINGDGKVDMVDVSRILRKFQGLDNF